MNTSGKYIRCGIQNNKFVIVNDEESFSLIEIMNIIIGLSNGTYASILIESLSKENREIIKNMIVSNVPNNISEHKIQEIANLMTPIMDNKQ